MSRVLGGTVQISERLLNELAAVLAHEHLPDQLDRKTPLAVCVCTAHARHATALDCAVCGARMLFAPLVYHRDLGTGRCTRLCFACAYGRYLTSDNPFEWWTKN